MHIQPRMFAILLAISLTTAAFAEGTRTWEQSKFEELTKGTATGIAIRSVGGLELAPAFKALYTAPSTYIWSITSDDAGNIYAAAGSPARVYRITPDGQATTVFEPTELQVQALVVDKNGVIYAGTAPDGKVYKIEHKSGAKIDSTAKSNPPDKSKGQVDPNWTSSVYFDPGTKYIWDLALDNSGDIFVATGDKGEIYRVTPKGEHSVFFKSDEAHIRVLALDPKGNLIAGSDGSGLVYRISPSGEAFVLYSAPKKEITALALDGAGNIYAAGVGEKRPSSGLMPGFGQPTGPTPSTSPAPPLPPGVVLTPTQSSMTGMMNFPAPGAGATGGSEIYQIAPDGSPTRLWTSREDIVYALAFDPQGRLLAGTGNRGHVFAMKREDDFTDLLKAGASQVTAFAKAPGGGLYASGSNLGKIFVLGPALQTEGTYESDVFDAKIFSRWGRADFRGTGNIDLFARSGNVDNPDRNWSPWKKIDNQTGETGIPAARFAQWKAVLHSGSPAPRLDSLTLNYLSKNMAPDIDDVGVQVAVRYQPLPKPMGTTVDLGSGTSGITPVQPRFEPPVPSTHDRDSLGVKWVAHDDNDDQLTYSLYYRGDGESRWLLLKDGLTDKFYSFDASLLPDGGYTFKVVASDAPSHTPGEALTTEKESPRVEVDTTPPRIENIAAALEGDKIHVSFRAVDGFSIIKRAEYSVDAEDWQYVEPVGQLTDAKTENYDFKVAIPVDDAGTAPVRAAVKGKKNDPTSGPVEHVVVVRVYDRYDNMSSVKTVIRGK